MQGVPKLYSSDYMTLASKKKKTHLCCAEGNKAVIIKD